MGLLHIVTPGALPTLASVLCYVTPFTISQSWEMVFFLKKNLFVFVFVF